MKRILTLALVLVSAACFAQKISLSLNLKQGDTYYMTTNAKLAIVETVQGKQQQINSTIVGKMSFKVLSANDTAYTMETKFDRIAMQMQSGGQDINFDSDAKGDDVFSTLMRNMTNKPFNIVMTKRGKVASIDGLDKIYSGMFDGLPNLTDEQKSQFKDQMLQSFGPKAFKGNIELGTAIFPETPVARGDQWVINTVLQSTMSAKVKTTFTMQDVSDNSYNIHGDATLATDNNAPYVDFAGMPLKYNMSGTSTYEIKLDKATGWTTEAKINQLMKGNVDIKDNPKVPGGMSIPMTLTTDQTITDK